MTGRRRRLPGRRRLPFHRLATISLVVAATVPVSLMGLLIYDQVGKAVRTDARDRTAAALTAARTAAAQANRDLDSLVRSYADWGAFAAAVSSGDLASVQHDVLDFLVEQGTVSGAVVTSAKGSASSGPADLVLALRETVGSSATSPRVITVGSEIFLIDDDVIHGPSTVAEPVGNIILARALDARFAADLASLTGFAVGIAGADGVVVATSPIVDAPALGATGGAVPIVDGDVTGGSIQVVEGWPNGTIVLASRISVLGVVGGTLPLITVLVVASTALVAMLLAVLLARILGRQLGTLHDGLTAVADGRVPPPIAIGANDDVGRLASGLERLVQALDRRETVLRRCLAAAASVPIHLSPVEAAARLGAATDEIFGFSWSRVVTGDGLVLGAPTQASHEDAAAAPRVVDAPLGLGTDGRRLEACLPDGAAWSDGDQASLEVMGLLMGTVIDEAEAYGRAAGRADRLDRLNTLQREFLRSISHNLRAPLATIELAATDLEEMFEQGYARERTDAILHEERRLARLVNQVLILSRMETNTLQLDGEPVALGPLGVRVARELDVIDRVDLQDRSGGEVAFADPMATEQIAWILIDNAIHYAHGSPIHLEVLPAGGSAETGPMLVLAVEDEGPGVPAADRRRIFQRFVRGSATGGDGTGLGLSVARGLARSLGGDVVYRPGRVGARFEIHLPSGGGAPREP